MAKQRTGGKAGGQTEHKAYWQQPWVKRVMQGDYSAFEKLLFMRMASFGAKGCSMKNITLMAEFGCSESTVRKAITKLWIGRDLMITNWNGHGRRIYAAKNPEVITMFGEKYKKERAAGTVNDKMDLLRIMRVRGYTTPSELTGYPVEDDGVGGKRLPGHPVKSDGDSISKNQERSKEQEKRRANSSSPADRQPNPPAKAGIQAAIRAKLERMMPKRRKSDLAEGVRRLDISVKIQGAVEELMAGGLGFEEAFDRVYNENQELINGGVKK